MMTRPPGQEADHEGAEQRAADRAASAEQQAANHHCGDRGFAQANCPRSGRLR